MNDAKTVSGSDGVCGFKVKHDVLTIRKLSFPIAKAILFDV